MIAYQFKVLLMTISVTYTLCDRGAFTSFVNLEKLYTLEDELITISDVILNRERTFHGENDVHSIYNITGIITKVKTIHRDVLTTRTMTSYIVHPINIYHLTKRLVKDWTKVIATIEESRLCAQVMRVKIENLADNIPTGTNLNHVIEGILRLQTLYNISVDDVISGRAWNTVPLSAITLDEAFEFARVAYETEKFYLATEWLKYVTDMYDGSIANFNFSNAMNLLSSSYFKMQRPKEALSVLEKLLSKDPRNNVAERNSKFLIQKIDEGMKDRDVSFQTAKGKKERMLQKLCSRIKENTGLFCFYSASRRNPPIFEKPAIKTEVLSRRPLIVLYHNITGKSEQKALAHLGYEQMKEVMYKNHYSHPQGMSGMAVRDRTHWQWVPRLQKRLEDLPISQRYPEESHLVIKNIGMDGLENVPFDRSERTRIGTFLAFLSEPSSSGGIVVFPFAGTNIKPIKGNVVFYERKAHRQATICPVMGDTFWVAVYPLQDPFYSDVCYKDLLLRPKRNLCARQWK